MNENDMMKNANKAVPQALLKAYSSVFTWDLKNDTFETLYVDPRFEQFASGGRADIERFIAQFVPPEDRDVLRLMTDCAYLRGRLRFEEKVSFTLREMLGKEERTMHAVILRGEDADHAAAAFIDVTSDVKRHKEEAEKLEAASAAKTNFLFNMSHDIRTPMNAIKGYSMLAKKYIHDTAKVGDYLKKIDAAGSNLLALMNQVLEMSSIESGKTVLAENRIDILDEFYAMLTVITANAEQRGIRITGSGEEIRDRIVIGDEGRINQIFINVLGNAVKYTPEGGEISFTVRQEEADRPGYAAYVFTVKDTGIGMNSEFLKYIYDEFSREQNTTGSGVEGVGLGMAIVKRLIDLMDGEISIQSRKGKGTAVTVSLQLKTADPNSKEEPIDASRYDFKGHRVLLVEDNEMNREIAREILTETGLAVEEAEDGDVAVDMVKNAKAGYFDMIFMDIQMPRMSGYEAAHAIRELDNAGLAGIPIIAMTANAFEEDRRNALAAGMNEHLAKPIDVTKLIKTIARFL